MSTCGPRFPDLAALSLRSGVPIRFRAGGQSMTPSIPSGALLTVAPIDPSAIRPGDVILYESSHGLRLHRVIGVPTSTSGVVWARGDAPDCETEQVPLESVLGKLVLALPADASRSRLERAGRRVRQGLRATRRLFLTLG